MEVNKYDVLIPHLHICARASPRHLHEHLYASVSVRMHHFHMSMNIHMFVHVKRIAIRPLWLVFEKLLRKQAPRKARRMTQWMTRRICDWYARCSPCYSPRPSNECVNSVSDKPCPKLQKQKVRSHDIWVELLSLNTYRGIEMLVWWQVW